MQSDMEVMRKRIHILKIFFTLAMAILIAAAISIHVGSFLKRVAGEVSAHTTPRPP